LISAPPAAMSSTSPEVANCVSAEIVSTCSALFVCLTISWYLSICASMCIALSARLVMCPSACVSLRSSERQKGMKPFRILWRDS
jgi:hypothetical protein